MARSSGDSVRRAADRSMGPGARLLKGAGDGIVGEATGTDDEVTGGRGAVGLVGGEVAEIAGFFESFQGAEAGV